MRRLFRSSALFLGWAATLSRPLSISPRTADSGPFLRFPPRNRLQNPILPPTPKPLADSYAIYHIQKGGDLPAMRETAHLIRARTAGHASIHPPSRGGQVRPHNPGVAKPCGLGYDPVNAGELAVGKQTIKLAWRALCALAFMTCAAQAQVMEIRADGTSVTFSGPVVSTADGTMPLAPSAPMRMRAARQRRSQPFVRPPSATR